MSFLHLPSPQDRGPTGAQLASKALPFLAKGTLSDACSRSQFRVMPLVHPMAAVGLLRAQKHAGARVLGVAVKVT